MDHETAKRVVFEAYLVSLPLARAAADDRDALSAYLGDVDRQAGSMEMQDRMVLAGRVLAASVALAGGQTPEPSDIQSLIDARLSYSRAQREQAAPLGDGRLWPEDEAAPGLGALIRDADEDELAEECATVASYVLQFGLRSPMDVDAALTVGEELREIVLEGDAMLDVGGDFGLADQGPGGLLGRAAVSARGFTHAQEITVGDDDRVYVVSPRDSWIQLTACLVAARARWMREPFDWTPAITRATERIASSLVLEEPERFAAKACAVHALDVIVDTATTWLDEALPDPAPDPDEDRDFIWEGLLEAASSGLVGAWVQSRG